MYRWLCLLALVASCSKDSQKSQTGSGSGAAPASPKVALYVDDQLVGEADAQQITQWPRLDSLLPVTARRLGTWQTVYLISTMPHDGKTATKTSELNRPSSTYPDLVPALFPGANGPAFGMFDPVELARHGQPSLREDALKEVRVKLAQNSGRGENEHGGGEATDPSTLKITVKTLTGEKVIEGKQLLEVPRQPMPGETGEGRGWALQTILELGGIKQFERIVLTDAAGMSLNLDKADFTAKSIPFVKLNRQGALRVRIFKQEGASWQQSGDLRGLVGIRVLK